MSEGYAGGLGEHEVGGAGRKSDRDAAHAIGPAPEQTYSWNGGMCLRCYLQRIANWMLRALPKSLTL